MLGLSRQVVEQLLIHFKETYIEEYKLNLEKKLPKEIYHRFCIKNKEDLLFFTFRCSPPQKKSRKRVVFIRESIGEI